MVIRFLTIIVLFLWLGTPAFGHDPYSEPEEVEPAGAILDVNILSYEATGYHPECGKDCIYMGGYNRYSADVNRVLDGEFLGKHIEFIVLEGTPRAFSKGQRAIIMIDKIDSEEGISKMQAAYLAQSIGFAVELVCLDLAKTEAADNGTFQRDYAFENDDQRCFNPDHLETND